MANKNETLIGKQRSPLYFTWQRLKKNKGAVIGLCFLCFLAVLLICADFMFDYDDVVIKMNVKERLPPWMTRARTSRPDSSVPNQWAAEGHCRRSFTFILMTTSL